MLSIVRVRHVTPHGAPYTRRHSIIVRHTGIDIALHDEGIIAPIGAPHTVKYTPLPEICYAVHPIALDPAHIIVHITGVPGGVFVRVPYQCTMQQLVQVVIPARLKGIGVHRYDVAGTLCLTDGTPARTGHIWRQHPVEVWWTKLGVRVSYDWPSAAVIRAIRRAQIAWAHDDGWTTLTL